MITRTDPVINKCGLLVGTLILPYVMLSCIPIFDSGVSSIFKNCTNDTLFIGASHTDNIDNVDYQLRPYTNCDIDSVELLLWKGEIVNASNLVCPDSICLINDYYLFPDDNDTCYFFLVKWRDAKKYSWDEIRAKKLYRRWVTVKNKDGEFDSNIKYD